MLLTIIAVTNVSEARQPRRGYRGFVEWSSSVRSDNVAVFDNQGNFSTDRQGSFYTGFSRSHGCQINPMFFIGAGLGLTTAFGNLVTGVGASGLSSSPDAVLHMYFRVRNGDRQSGITGAR